MPLNLLPICDDLRTALTRCRYDADTLLDTLGADAHAALGRSEPVPVRRAANDTGDLGTLIRLFLLADTCSRAEVARALAPLDVDRAVDAGLLEHDGDGIAAALDVRPLDTGGGTRWVISDLDGSIRPREVAADHVIGVGQASLSLLRAIPTEPVGTVLDLGTGCGVQAVHCTHFADRITATDVNHRAVDLAAATAALNGLDVEVVQGSWFEPVKGRSFDLVVANPPFVVGSATVNHSYRDSGLDLDGASELVVSGVPDLLNPGGTAALLASWVHVEGEDWRTRVSSWLPDHGIDAWFVQRDVADPALYVGTWLRDGGLDAREPAVQELAERWLDHFAAARVEGIGFGFVYLRAIDDPTEVLAEDLSHGFDDPLGPESSAYFARSQWLREHDVLDARFTVEPSTALQRVSRLSDEGWEQIVSRLHRGNGPAWEHEVDDLAVALVGGMRADGLVLSELVELLAAAHGEDVTDELRDNAIRLVTGLVRHGLVLPA